MVTLGIVAALPGAMARAAPVSGTSCALFPADNVWNADISGLPLNPQSPAWMSKTDTGANLHPDWGTPTEGYGMPLNVVSSSHSQFDFTAANFDYPGESDQGPYPFGSDTRRESPSDSHALMINSDTCTLYELYAAAWNNGAPHAGSGAVFHLTGPSADTLRPDGWTSADAAGLPIAAGLVRVDEVQGGTINHALRFTIQCSGNTYIWPARHRSGSCQNAVPYGARFRLRAAFSIAGFSPQTQVILRGLQHYGMFVADIGSDWFIQGTQDATWGSFWGQTIIDELKTVPASQFEAIDESSLMGDSNSARVRGSAPPPSSPRPVASPSPPIAGPATSPSGAPAFPLVSPPAGSVSPPTLATPGPAGTPTPFDGVALGPGATATSTPAVRGAPGTTGPPTPGGVMAAVIGGTLLLFLGIALGTVWMLRQSRNRRPA